MGIKSNLPISKEILFFCFFFFFWRLLCIEKDLTLVTLFCFFIPVLYKR